MHADLLVSDAAQQLPALLLTDGNIGKVRQAVGEHFLLVGRDSVRTEAGGIGHLALALSFDEIQQKQRTCRGRQPNLVAACNIYVRVGIGFAQCLVSRKTADGKILFDKRFSFSARIGKSPVADKVFWEIIEVLRAFGE